MEGVITIAVGNSSYGRMAINLAMSVLHKGKYPIDIIYSPSAFEGIEWGLQYFNNAIEVENSSNPSKQAMDLKLSLDKYSRFSRTLFLDADTIICPSRSVESIFLGKIAFKPQNYANNRLCDKPAHKYETWMDYKLISAAFGLPEDSVIPQINTSCILWHHDFDYIFEEARKIKDELLLCKGIKEWRGEIPDELCFNIACCKTETHLSVSQPIYIGSGGSKEYVIDNYIGLSVIGLHKDPHQIALYNEFADYYGHINGLVEHLHYESKKPLRPKKPLFPHKTIKLATIGGFGEVSNGGIINPTAWKEGENYKIILRVDENLEGYKGDKSKARCRPYLATYDKEFKLRELKALRVTGLGLFEDWRVMESHKDNRKWFGCSHWDGEKWVQAVSLWECYDDGYMNLHHLYKSEKDEKNWAWFIRNGYRYYIYSIEPFISKSDKCDTLFNHDFKSGWAAEGFIACSTFPVKYGDDYLMWVHKKQKDLTYLNSVLIFDGKTLLPKYFIPQHVLGDEMNHPLYISSCLVEDERILIFGGEGGVKEMPNASVKHATVRIIDRNLFDSTIKQYPCQINKNYSTN